VTSRPGGLDGLSAQQRELLDSLLADRGLGATGGEATGRAAGVPLSITQQRLWASGALVPETPFGNLALVFRLRGTVDARLLEHALHEVVRRQGMLRTVFTNTASGAIHQVPLEGWTPPLERVSLLDLPATERWDQAWRLTQEVAGLPFRFAEQPLMRAVLYWLDDTDHLLALVTHHLAADGWGIRILLHHLAAFYRAGLGTSAPPPPPAMQYAEYTVGQRAWLASADANAQLGYWRRRLADAPRHLPLPLDRPAPARPSFVVEAVPVAIGRALADAARRVARAEGVTLYTALLTAWLAVLHRVSERDDVIVGSIISNRTRREVEHTVGNFGANVFLRVDFSDRPDFRTLLRRVHAVVLEAHEHQDVPLEGLLRTALGAEPARLPLFHVMFLLRDSPLERHLDLPGVTVEATTIKTWLSTLDLSLDLTDTGETVVGFLEYKTALFDRETAALLSDALVAAVQAAGADPGSPHFDLPLPERLRDRRAVAARPPATSPGSDAAFETPAERALGAAWREILRIPAVGPQDNFFDLGGDSLMAMAVIERVEQETGHRLQPLELATQTLRQLAALGTAPAPGEDRQPPRGSLLGRVVRALSGPGGT